MILSTVYEPCSQCELNVRNKIIIKTMTERSSSSPIVINVNHYVQINGFIWEWLPQVLFLNVTWIVLFVDFRASVGRKSPQILIWSRFHKLHGPIYRRFYSRRREWPLYSPPSSFRLHRRCLSGGLAFAVNTWRNLINKGPEYLITSYEFTVHPVLHLLKVLWF